MGGESNDRPPLGGGAFQCARAEANEGEEEPAAPQVQARRLLNLFQFPAARWNDRVGRLSGGEKRRLQLLKVLAINPNFLVLDEPTNDLDILSLQILEDFLLNDYKGCLVIVSHDRYVSFGRVPFSLPPSNLRSPSHFLCCFPHLFLSNFFTFDFTFPFIILATPSSGRGEMKS